MCSRKKDLWVQTGAEEHIRQDRLKGHCGQNREVKAEHDIRRSEQMV